MRLTSRIVEEKVEEEYPKIMASDNYIVLFECESKGTVLSVCREVDCFEVGDHASTFDMSCFHPWHGTIQISN